MFFDDQNRVFDCIKKFATYTAMQIFFDVGAHIGQSSRIFLKHFPESKVYAFEPSQKNINKFDLSGFDESHFFLEQLALGNKDCNVSFLSKGSSGDMVLENKNCNNIVRRFLNFVQKETKKPHPEGKDISIVKMLKGDTYCKAKNIQKISFLKIDTEGHDLSVMQGFAEMIKAQNIDFFQVEAGFGSTQKFVQIETFIRFARFYNYHLFGIFEQSMEKKYPCLRRANVVFISHKEYLRNQGLRNKQAPLLSSIFGST